MVSNEIREKFKKLYKEKFDIVLTDEEATQMAGDLVTLVKVLVRPDVKATQETQPREERRTNEVIRIQPNQ
jgi:hypothetical protein